MFAQDYIEPIDAPVPDGCDCEQALDAKVDRLSRENHSLRDELSVLKAADADAAKMAQEVIQAETLEEAKDKARVYLGLASPF
jgi:hypothetical protein